MQRFQLVPRRTDGRSSLQTSTQTTLVHSETTPRQIQQIVHSGSRLASLRYLRHSLAALSIPVTLLAGTVLPPSIDGVSSKNAPVLTAAASNEAVGSTIRPANSVLSQGSIALGAPQADTQESPRVALPSYDAADLALQYVGSRYRYGGASPRGFDCSGLTMYVYGQLGVDLPHKASMQSNEAFGQRIETIEDLAPGDLVFFKRTTRARGITHVSLYVGDGMMVSANSPKTGVQHVSIYSSYWKSRFAGGLRPYR